GELVDPCILGLEAGHLPLQYADTSRLRGEVEPGCGHRDPHDCGQQEGATEQAYAAVGDLERPRIEIPPAVRDNDEGHAPLVSGHGELRLSSEKQLGDALEVLGRVEGNLDLPAIALAS